MIKLSNIWSYALKSVIYISNNSDKLIRIKDISSSQNISESLLRRIIASLEKASILETMRWRDWWVKLARELKDISLYDVLLAVGENLSVRDCTMWIECSNSESCVTTNVLNNLQKSFNWVLKLYTLDKVKE